ncbi:hypothetical protein [Mycoplasma phocimorsus]|uniref:hypothetical protein n=1 Tax=Mycoplasma phocimorsus TaxID=3045839 RepID=UPI0024C0E385|nr:hypothetical protein [Mycoplasma phocimorsus]MDJ1647609.1 hypothetical protein [Mycoplasma phocimorsus]
MKLKNIIRWITSTVGMASTFLISASISNSYIYEIQYKNTDNIDVNNLTRKYNSNAETKLFMPKAKNGFIFSGWKLKNEKIIDKIAVGTQENIILSPVLINEYPNYSFIKNLFINNTSKINFDIRIIKIKQLIAKEELVFGNEKYELQKLIVELINNFNNKLMQDTIFDFHFASGSHASSETKVSTTRTINSVSIKNSETLSVWKLLWKEVKGWWNNWMSTVFYGLVGVGATIGIGYSAYTAYWNNKINFNLKENEGLKITLEFYPEIENKDGYWFGRFYNNSNSVKIECLCQRRFKKRNANNSQLFIEYVLTNQPKNSGFLLYNVKNCDDTGEGYFDTDFIAIKDHYPGSNEISIIGFENGKKDHKKLGRLVIAREKIIINQTKNICNPSSSNEECKCSCKSLPCESDTIKKCNCMAIEEKCQNNNS